MSRKSERLVNLTIALLATRRYLTKAEIFSTVAGYSGDPEAKDRMFERDKDDLRSLGITIELGTFDPLFEDEAGYRIKPETYSLQISDLDTLSIALLSQAAKVWRDAALGESAQLGLRKLKGLGVDSDIESVPELHHYIPSTPDLLSDVVDAVSNRIVISFVYLDSELSSQRRTIEPYRISNSKGYWYLIGRDTEKNAVRTFRIDRFASEVSLVSQTRAFEVELEELERIDQEIEEVSFATVAIRKGNHLHFRDATLIGEIDGEWDEFSLPHYNSQELLRDILWLGDDAYIISPPSLRDQMISILDAGLVAYE